MNGDRAGPSVAPQREPRAAVAAGGQVGSAFHIPAWRRFGRAARRRRSLVALVTVLGSAVGLTAASSLDPRYAATVTLAVESTSLRSNVPAALSVEQLEQSNRWVDLVTSGAVLGPVVRSRRFYVLPRGTADVGALASFRTTGQVKPGHYRLVTEAGPDRYRLEAENGRTIERGALGESIGAGLGFSWTPSRAAIARGAPVEFAVIAPHEAERRLARALQVRGLAGGLQIELRGEDSALTVATVNAIAEQAVAAAAELTRREFDERAQALDRQVEHARGVLASAEAAVNALPRGARPPLLALRATLLEREVASAAAAFNEATRRHDEARLALIGTPPPLKLVATAGPPELPRSRHAGLLMGLSFAISLGLALVAVALVDRGDPRIRHPEHVTQGLKLGILGAIPHARRFTVRRGARAASVVETLRAIRWRVLSACGDAPFALTVASPGPGDGKSFVAANLGLAFGQAGYRVTLVDGDVRRGVLHDVLDVDAAPGLTDVLAGQIKLGAALRRTPHAGVWLLGSGSRVQSATELLHSPRLREVMDQLRRRCEVVIVDSAPLAAGIDAFALAAAAGWLLVVLRVGATDCELATSKLEGVQRMPFGLLGAVLNDVRARDGLGQYNYGLAGYEPPPRDPAHWDSGRWAPALAGERR